MAVLGLDDAFGLPTLSLKMLLKTTVACFPFGFVLMGLFWFGVVLGFFGGWGVGCFPVEMLRNFFFFVLTKEKKYFFHVIST